MTLTNASSDRLAALVTQGLQVEIPSPDTDLFETGILDSFGLVSLMAMLEEEYGLRISVADLDLDNFRTLGRIAGFVGQRAA